MADRGAPSAAASPWPRRLALATAACAVPLLFFGGTVTTLHAGLAIDGWLILEPGRGDHFLWLYPIDKWFRDVGTFVEHTHRLLGSLVGLLAIATVVATFRADRRRLSRALACASLLAVVAQGVLGGLRVLEKSEDLALLHAALGQVVFALLGATAIVTSSGWAASVRGLPDRGSDLRRRSGAMAVLVYAQIVLGAWLRHGGSAVALGLHLALALAVIASAIGLARSLRLASESEGLGTPGAVKLLGIRKGLVLLLGLQLGLGLLAYASVNTVVGPRPTAVGRSVFPTLHVVVGAALLLECVAAWLWSSRLLLPGRRTPALETRPGLEAAR